MIERSQALLIALMLVGAPILGGGKSIYTLLFLELSGLLLLALTLGKNDLKIKFPKLVWVNLIFGLALPLIYLIPLPQSIWENLPGRTQFLAPLTWYNANAPTPIWLSLSLVPEKTVHAALSLIPLVAIFLAVASLTSANLIRLSYLLMTLASIEALWGIAQYTTQLTSLFPFGAHNHATASPDAIGSYLNRDHFVALLYMVLPIALGQLFCSFRKKTTNYKETQLATETIIKLILITLAILLLILGATLSRSRAGIFLTILALVVSTVMFARHLGGKRSASLVSTLIIGSLGLALSIGINPILNRFIALDPFEDGRWGYFKVAIEGIQQFFPIGTGPSTFQEIYRGLQTYDQMGFLNHVHNDYLELVFETGVFGILFIALGLLAYIIGWLRLRTALLWDEQHFLKVSAGLGAGLLFLHALVDFNFHTPANALVFSLLLSIFLKEKES